MRTLVQGQGSRADGAAIRERNMIRAVREQGGVVGAVGKEGEKGAEEGAEDYVRGVMVL